jgi:hypothetical protein
MTALWKTAAFVLAALAAAGVAAAEAQMTTPPAAPEQHRPAQPPAATSPRGSTSETLGQAHGVLPPPRTGDSNVIAPQNRDKTPTPDIAPPGTPGGSPNVVPK